MKFFIVTPHLNSKDFPATFASVVRQEETNFSWVVVDDYSDESYFNLVADLCSTDSRVTLIRNTGRRGAGNARNIGLEYIIRNYSDTTDFFLTFIDSDDLWDRGFLGFMKNLLVENGYSIASCSYRMIWPSGEEYKYAGEGEYTVLSNSIDYRMACLTTMLYLQSWSDIDGIRFGVTERGNDQPFFVGFLRDVEVGLLSNEALASYRCGNSNSISGKKVKMIAARWRLYKNTYEFSFFKRCGVVLLWGFYAFKKYYMRSW